MTYARLHVLMPILVAGLVPCVGSVKEKEGKRHGVVMAGAALLEGSKGVCVYVCARAREWLFAAPCVEEFANQC